MTDRLSKQLHNTYKDASAVLDDAIAAERAKGWHVTETAEEDGSWSIVSDEMPGLVVAGDNRADAWRQWPEVVELWASAANEMRVESERGRAADRRATVQRMENEGVVTWSDKGHRDRFLEELASGL